MSGAAVTRDGLRGVRPGREARSWSGADSAYRVAEPDSHPGASYYGQPVINAPPWKESEIAGYLFTGGLAGASSLLAAGAGLTGRPDLARRAELCASAAAAVSLAALVADLGRPTRFINMLRVFKPTSPMSVGTWMLSAYVPLTVAATIGDLLARTPRTSALARGGAGALGAGVATYTAALISNTSVPAWRDGRRELPFLFAGSAASAAGGFGLIAAPAHERGPAARMGAIGAVGELVAEMLLERRLGDIADTLHEGTAGRRLRAAKALSAVGALGAAVCAGGCRRRSTQGVARAAGAALMAGSLLTRFGLFAAGLESARDPKYTVDPQRRRLDADAR
ncbi:MAG: NrfD/PsrC family molybdoenzyme membrane anchor subunit [Solirubrobacteraceae bacterium]